MFRLFGPSGQPQSDGEEHTVVCLRPYLAAYRFKIRVRLVVRDRVLLNGLCDLAGALIWVDAFEELPGLPCVFWRQVSEPGVDRRVRVRIEYPSLEFRKKPVELVMSHPDVWPNGDVSVPLVGIGSHAKPAADLAIDFIRVQTATSLEADGFECFSARPLLEFYELVDHATMIAPPAVADTSCYPLPTT